MRFSGSWAWLNADPRRFDLVVALLTAGIGTVLALASPEDFDAGWPEWVAGVGAFVMVMLRRRWPMLLLGLAVVAAGVNIIVRDRPSPMVFAGLVLLATVASRIERRPAIALGGVLGICLYAAFRTLNDVEFGDGRALIGIAWCAVAVGIGDARRSWRRYRASTEAELRSTVMAAEAETRRQVTEERLSIARELHDLLAHNLSVMNVQTGAAMHLLRSNPEGAEEALGVARDAGRSVLDELRELLSVLRDDSETGEGEAPTSSLPTVDDVPRLIETMRSSGLRVTHTESGQARPLTPGVSLAAYRIVQESLTNAATHGDGAVELAETWADAGLSIRVANRPGDPNAGNGVGGHGLLGMRERALGNGGTFESGLVDGEFVVHAVLPVSIARSSDEERVR